LMIFRGWGKPLAFSLGQSTAAAFTVFNLQRYDPRMSFVGVCFLINNSVIVNFAAGGGPIFNQVILAVGLNRATRDAEALCGSYDERQFTRRSNHAAADPLFWLVATQNPHEHHGTISLPNRSFDRLYEPYVGFRSRQRKNHLSLGMTEAVRASETCLKT